MREDIKKAPVCNLHIGAHGNEIPVSFTRPRNIICEISRPWLEVASRFFGCAADLRTTKEAQYLLTHYYNSRARSFP